LNDFESLSIDQIPISANGNTLVDVFVYFTHSEKFVKILAAGVPLNREKLESVKDHSDPNLYVRQGALKSAESMKNQPSKLQSIKTELGQLGSRDRILDLNKKIREELKEILFFLRQDPQAVQADSQMTLLKMESLAEDILEVVAPDIEDLRRFLVRNLKYVTLMEDAAALTSIAVTTVLAHGFDSRAIFRDLSLATTLMDAPLADLSDDIIIKYYLEPAALSNADQEIIKHHPITSAQAFSIRIKSFSPTVVHLILGHHELFNGRGYPKGTRSELLPAVVRSFALAVDIFETMKRAKLRGQEIDLVSAVKLLIEKDVPAHMRRHNQKLVSSLVSFLEKTA